MNIGERIKAVRDAKGLSMRAFAESIKITASSVNKLEKGENTPAPRTLDAICYKHNVNPKWLRGEDEAAEMFLEPLSREERIDDLMNSDDDFIRNLLTVCADMTDDEWRLLEKIIKKLAKEKK